VTVTMLDSAVVKADTGTIAAEAAKLNAYATFSGNNFIVPKVLYCDSTRRVMILERLHGYVSLQDIYLHSARDSVSASAVFWEAGVVLARIHLRSDVTESWVKVITGDAKYHPGKLLLHGDFGFSNVLFRHPGEPLAILDPCPPGATSSSMGVGSPIDDLALMFSCLIGRVPVSHMMRVPSLPRMVLMNSMFSGYGSIRPPECDFRDALASGTRILRDYLTRRRFVPVLSVPTLVSWLAHSL
jgi:fructosamine-3-kinase